MMISELLACLSGRGIHLWVEQGLLRYSAPDSRALDDTLRDAIRARRDELLPLLSSTQQEALAPPISTAASGADVTCSRAQQGFLFSAELDGSSDPYKLGAAFRIRGALQVAALEQALKDVVRRNEVLRCRFEPRAGGRHAIVPTDWQPELELSHFDGSEAELLVAIGADESSEFNLISGPHLAAKLYRMAADWHVLRLSIHHIVSDGASIPLFARELQACYAWRAGLTHQPPPLPTIQFRDVAHSQSLASDPLEAKHLDFWRRELDGAPALLALPGDRARPARRTANGGNVPIRLEPKLLERLQAVKSAWRVSEFQIAAAALWLLLHQYSGQASVVIGTPWKNRESPGSEHVIGPLINLLPLHIRPAREASLGGLLIETKNRTLAAIEHGCVPFEQIVSLIRPERSAAHTPIFQAMCAIDTTPADTFQLPELSIEPLELPNEAARYDVALVMQRASGALSGGFKYSADLFDRTTALRMADHFVSALELLLFKPALPIARAQLMRPVERERVLVEWNRTERAYPLDKTLGELFEEQVRKSPDRVAVRYEGSSLTYAALNQAAHRAAHRLIANGVSKDDVVGITLGRSLELIVAILAVVKCGAAYLAIDEQHPPERRDWLLQDAAVRAVIGPSSIGAPKISLPDAGAHEPSGDLRLRIDPDVLCYVIHTSGSTGQPKGVATSHRAIVNNLLWMADEWPLRDDDVVLFKSSPGFDVSVKEIFWPLISGVCLAVAPTGAAKDPERLCRIIEDAHVSVVHMVPTMLDYFLRHGGTARANRLRIVMCGGEALSPALRARFHASFDALLLHLYGPTEAAIAVTGYAISAGHADVPRLPLGTPMPNCRIYIVNPALEATPVGVAGELCIAGTPLARGYIRRPELTADKFVPDPFSAEPGARMYLTGDLARWRADGQVEYLGRIDRQVKLNGLRIEPGEIEAQLRAHGGVDDALVLVRPVGDGNALVAYVASRAPELSGDALQRALRSRMPAFMVPARIIILPAFPMNVNGKVDVQALPPPSATGSAGSPAQRGPSTNPPQGEREQQLARLWCQLLKLEALDRDDEFFDLGGHSLLILELQKRLRDELGVSVSVADLFLHPTVASLAAHLDESKIGRTKGWLKKMMGSGPRSAS